MIKIPNLYYFIYPIALISLLFSSCTDSDKKESTFLNDIFSDNEIESKINFKTVASLYETNKKNIVIASIAFNNSKELKESQIILKIKKDHQNFEFGLKKIANENLIIIPEPIFDLNLDQKNLKGISSSYYLISLLEKEINNQIVLLDSIKKNSKDTQFKAFADKSKKILIENNNSLEELLVR
jgi:tRNA-binding EMAP/Myf-like protein